MHPKSLLTFLTIVETGSFRATAERLNVTQSTVSARVRELERHLGHELFERVGRGVALREAGRALVEPARRIVAEVDRVETELGDPAMLNRRLRVGVVEVIAISWLSDLVAAVDAAWPRARLDITVRPTETLVSLLTAREIDLALVPTPLAGGGLERVGLGSVSWSIHASPTLGLHDAPVRAEDLAERRVLTLGPGSMAHGAVRSWFAREGVEPMRLTCCDSISAVLSMTRAGLGVSCLPTNLGATFERGLVALDHRPLEATWDYAAACLAGSTNAFAREVARLARQASGFAARSD